MEVKMIKNLLVSGVVTALFVPTLVKAEEKKVASEKAATVQQVEFIGCWDTTLVKRDKESENVMGFKIQGRADLGTIYPVKPEAESVIVWADRGPRKGWTLCMEGSFESKAIQVTDAYICTSDESAGPCDSNSRIANSALK
jgi:hypothetical protein